MTWGYGNPIPCEVTEVEPVGESLLYQNQYRLNLATNLLELHRVPSPPIGIEFLNVESWGPQLDVYLDDLLDNKFNGFPDTCFRGYECEIQRDLLRPLHQYFLDSTDTVGDHYLMILPRKLADEQQPLPRLCLKLVVMTYIMTHSLTLLEDTRDTVASRLRNAPAEPYGVHTCPRWLNKELKFVLASLHKRLLHDVLELIHRTLHDMSTNSSYRFWATLFIGLLVLSMVTESLQVAVRCKEETDMSDGIVYSSRNHATLTIEKSDETLAHVTSLFHSRYHMDKKGKNEINPIKNLKDRKNLKDSPSEALADKVKGLIEGYRKSG